MLSRISICLKRSCSGHFFWSVIYMKAVYQLPQVPTAAYSAMTAIIAPDRGMAIIRKVCHSVAPSM